MKTFNTNRKFAFVLAAVAILVIVLPLVTRLSSARTASTNITVTNNSSREIWHLFLSPPDSDKWGPDQLHDARITPNQSFTLSDVACAQASIKLVAEDENGCFLYQTVACGADSSWSITNDATPDCGN
jgi:hypothetical protein